MHVHIIGIPTQISLCSSQGPDQLVVGFRALSEEKYSCALIVMLRHKEPSSSDTKTLTSMTFSDDRAVRLTAFKGVNMHGPIFQLMQLEVVWSVEKTNARRRARRESTSRHMSSFMKKI